MFRNCQHLNSANNFSLIGIYVGNDNRENLEQNLKNAFKQIRNIKFLSLHKENETVEYPVKW